MSESSTSSIPSTQPLASSNVARRMGLMAAELPTAVAVMAPKKGRAGSYDTLTFRELDEESNRLASGLTALGVQPGDRMVLLVRPGLEFIALTFALFKVGAVAVLIDPGMGRKNLLACLAAVEPDGFIAIPQAQAARWWFRQRFPRARFNVTVGRRWFWDGLTLGELRRLGCAAPVCYPATAEEPAAIIFTTGSTGPPKGVLYRHGNFDAQVSELRDHYDIRPGGIDLAGFPLFGLFNAALGVTTIVPEMDPTRPAQVDPVKIVQSIQDLGITQAFGSPAIWNRVGPYCVERQIRLPTLQRVLSAGAPVPPHVLASMISVIAADGEVYTPYGASEALPVASISAHEVLNETRHGWAQGAGTCVGSRFPHIDWHVIRIEDGPIATLAAAQILAAGEIGELIVTGPVVTSEYVTRTEWNSLSKIADGNRFWHRMGDVGYFDARGRFWFCGRAAQRLITPTQTMFTIPCEAIFNQHPAVFRAALVGIGERGRQRPVIVVEPKPGQSPGRASDRAKLTGELVDLAQGNLLTREIRDFLFIRAMPVDIRHNAKIGREQLAVWAANQLKA